MISGIVSKLATDNVQENDIHGALKVIRRKCAFRLEK